MKRIIGVLAICSLSCGAFAQDSPKMMQETGMAKTNHKKKDCVMMKDGKMMVMKNGKSELMDNSIKLNNGTTVMTDGSIKMSDGSFKMLKEGQCMDMDGKKWMMKKKMPKDM
jgi:X-X-X-Leu-X-X-Gly heptad repeat protein